VPSVAQPPWVWMPTASPVASQMTGEPELPPVVSVWYCTVVPVFVTKGPTCVCSVWLAVPVSTPYPVMRM